MKYIGEKEVHQVEVKNISSNVVQLLGDFPVSTKGFELLKLNGNHLGNYSAYTTVYREIEGGAQFSNDGSVYIKPLPIIRFVAGVGGSLNGEAEQKVKKYDDLIIPKPVAKESYQFKGWSPEIPDSGEIDSNKVFTAVFEYIPSLEEIQEMKVAEMNAIQQQTIAAGVDVVLSNGETHHFALTTNDQLSIMGSVASGEASIKGTPWHINDESVHCQYYSAEDMALISKAAYTYVLFHVTYFRDLRIYIRSLQTKEAVESVVYGMMIPGECRSEVLQDMYTLMGGI
jgi:hypothetical protein